MLGEHPPEDAATRLRLVADDQLRRVLKYEQEMRAVLRLSLEPDSAGGLNLPMHRGLRIGWIEDALAPLRGQMPEDERRRLVYGLGATLGIEAFVWLTDIAGLAREEAAEVMRTNAARLLQATLAEQ